MVTDGRSPYPGGAAGIFKIQLGRTGETVAYLPPVYKVLTVKDRYTREIFKRTGHQVIITAYPANAGIRMETGNYRICIYDMDKPP